MAEIKKPQTDASGKHSWQPGTGWLNTVAGEIEHAAERDGRHESAPEGLGRRAHVGRHRKTEGIAA